MITSDQMGSTGSAKSQKIALSVAMLTPMATAIDDLVRSAHEQTSAAIPQMIEIHPQKVSVLNRSPASDRYCLLSRAANPHIRFAAPAMMNMKPANVNQPLRVSTS